MLVVAEQLGKFAWEIEQMMSANELADWIALAREREQARHLQHLAQITEQRRMRHSG